MRLGISADSGGLPDSLKGSNPEVDEREHRDRNETEGCESRSIARKTLSISRCRFPRGTFAERISAPQETSVAGGSPGRERAIVGLIWDAVREQTLIQLIQKVILSPLKAGSSARPGRPKRNHKRRREETRERERERGESSWGRARTRDSPAGCPSTRGKKYHEDGDAKVSPVRGILRLSARGSLVPFSTPLGKISGGEERPEGEGREERKEREISDHDKTIKSPAAGKIKRYECLNCFLVSIGRPSC